MDSYALLSILMDSRALSSTLIDLINSNGLSWTPIYSHGLLSVLMDSHALSSTLMDSRQL